MIKELLCTVKIFLLFTSVCIGQTMAISNTTKIAELQNSTFTLKNEAKMAPADIAKYYAAIEKADFTNKHFYEKRYTLTFDNGLEFELLSVKELLAKGVKIDNSIITASQRKEDEIISPTLLYYKLHEPSGIIMEMHGKLEKGGKVAR